MDEKEKRRRDPDKVMLQNLAYVQQQQLNINIRKLLHFSV